METSHSEQLDFVLKRLRDAFPHDALFKEKSLPSGTSYLLVEIPDPQDTKYVSIWFQRDIGDNIPSDAEMMQVLHDQYGPTASAPYLFLRLTLTPVSSEVAVSQNVFSYEQEDILTGKLSSFLTVRPSGSLTQDTLETFPSTTPLEHQVLAQSEQKNAERQSLQAPPQQSRPENEQISGNESGEETGGRVIEGTSLNSRSDNGPVEPDDNISLQHRDAYSGDGNEAVSDAEIPDLIGGAPDIVPENDPLHHGFDHSGGLSDLVEEETQKPALEGPAPPHQAGDNEQHVQEEFIEDGEPQSDDPESWVNHSIPDYEDDEDDALPKIGDIGSPPDISTEENKADIPSEAPEQRSEPTLPDNSHELSDEVVDLNGGLNELIEPPPNTPEINTNQTEFPRPSKDAIVIQGVPQVGRIATALPKLLPNDPLLTALSATISSIIGESPCYYSDAYFELNDLVDPLNMLPAILVAAAQWATPLVLKYKGKGGFSFALKSIPPGDDDTSLFGYSVTHLKASSTHTFLMSVAGCLEKCVVSFANGQRAVDLSPIVESFAMWADYWGLLADEDESASDLSSEGGL